MLSWCEGSTSHLGEEGSQPLLRGGGEAEINLTCCVHGSTRWTGADQDCNSHEHCVLDLFQPITAHTVSLAAWRFSAVSLNCSGRSITTVVYWKTRHAWKRWGGLGKAFHTPANSLAKERAQPSVFCSCSEMRCTLPVWWWLPVGAVVHTAFHQSVCLSSLPWGLSGWLPSSPSWLADPSQRLGYS